MELYKKHKNEIIRSICEIIAIPSVREQPLHNAPFGRGISQCLDYALNLGSSMGFKTRNLDGYAGIIEYGEGGKTLGIAAHLDVVPAGNGWTVNPYKGIVKNQAIYGRGAVDDKGPAIAAIYALKCIKDMGIYNKNRVRIILGTNEESGKAGIKYYLEKEEQPDFVVTPDSKFPVVNAEKGIARYKLKKCCQKTGNQLEIIDISGGEAVNMVPSSAYVKFLYDGELNQEQILKHRAFNNSFISISKNGKMYTITAEGKSAHASAPYRGINAISVLIGVLADLPGLNPEFMEYFKTVNSKIGYETDGKSLNLNVRDDVSGELTVNVGMLDFDGQSIETVIDIRYPVTFTQDYILSRLRENLAGIEIHLINNQNPIYIPSERKEIKTLLEIYENVTGKRLPPVTIGGGTYSRMFKNAVAFGPVTVEKSRVIHQPDERLYIKDLMDFIEIYVQLIKKVIASREIDTRYYIYC